MAQLIDEVEVGVTALAVKFLRAPRYSSITDDKFSLLENAATPVNSPFRPIELTEDYDSVSRRLTLYFANPLHASTSYTFTVEGLKDAVGNTFPTEAATFTSLEEVPLPEDIGQEDVEVPTVIEDFSVKADVFSVGTASASTQVPNAEFYITGTIPERDEAVVSEDYQNGRITIKFSVRPSIATVNSRFFTAQRKAIRRSFSRWEDVTTWVSLDPILPYVFVDFPVRGTDAPSVLLDDTIDGGSPESPEDEDADVIDAEYNEEGEEYFDEGYKYRVRVSRDVRA